MKILKAAPLGLLLLGAVPAFATPAGTPPTNSNATTASSTKPPKDQAAHNRHSTHPPRAPHTH